VTVKSRTLFGSDLFTWLCVVCACLQTPPGVSGKESARWILAQLRNNSQYEPIAAAASLAHKALQDAGVRTEEAAAAAADADADVAEYYMKVLLEVMACALQLLLQVRGTADGLNVYLPGKLTSRGV
jgi:hypothetical protein